VNGALLTLKDHPDKLPAGIGSQRGQQNLQISKPALLKLQIK